MAKEAVSEFQRGYNEGKTYGVFLGFTFGAIFGIIANELAPFVKAGLFF